MKKKREKADSKGKKMAENGMLRTEKKPKNISLPFIFRIQS